MLMMAKQCCRKYTDDLIFFLSALIVYAVVYGCVIHITRTHGAPLERQLLNQAKSVNMEGRIKMFEMMANKYTLIPQDICTGDVSILICVVSHVHHFEARSKWRAAFIELSIINTHKGDIASRLRYQMVFLITWDTHLDREAKRKLLQEHLDHGDIVQVTCFNLTSLSVLSWFERSCARPQYFLKISDDTFVNIRQLVDIIETASNRNPVDLILGHYVEDSLLNNIKDSGSFPKPHNQARLPDYITGSPFVVSKMAAGRIVFYCPSEPGYPELVTFINGECLEKAGVKVIFDHRLCYSNKTSEYVPDQCATYQQPGKQL